MAYWWMVNTEKITHRKCILALSSRLLKLPFPFEIRTIKFKINVAIFISNLTNLILKSTILIMNLKRCREMFLSQLYHFNYNVRIQNFDVIKVPLQNYSTFIVLKFSMLILVFTSLVWKRKRYGVKTEYKT